MECAVTVPDPGICDVDVAALQHRSVIGVLAFANSEVQCSPKDDAQLFGFLVAVDERADGAALYPPEAQLKVVTVDDPTPKPRPVGVFECALVQEVHVAGVVCHRSPNQFSDELAEHAAFHVSEVLARQKCCLLLVTARDGCGNLVMTFG